MWGPVPGGAGGGGAGRVGRGPRLVGRVLGGVGSREGRVGSWMSPA